jgi:AraC-like DNA-binding protein
MTKFKSFIISFFKFGKSSFFKKSKPKQPTPLVSKQRMTEIEEVVRKHLEEKKAFLQHSYSLKMFSEETGIPLYQLSAFVNKHYKMNFNDFINEFRILYSIDKLLKKEWMYKKLETIAGESGFNNRNTFISAFKKVTGVKPSEFLKDIKTGNVTNPHPGKIPAYKGQ